MAPGALLGQCAEEQRPSKRAKIAAAMTELALDEPDDVVGAVPSHPLGIKPLGNAYTATENIKSRCGVFARLPDELLNHLLETLDASALVRLGSTCKALYAFTGADELWRSLFIA